MQFTDIAYFIGEDNFQRMECIACILDDFSLFQARSNYGSLDCGVLTLRCPTRCVRAISPMTAKLGSQVVV